MQYWMISIINHYGYLGIALLILIENLFPPIPSEVILTFGGFLTTYTNMNLIGVILFSTLGSVLGAVVLYQIGSLVPVFKLEAIVEGRLGKLLHFKKEDVSHAVEWFDSKGNYTVFFCRFIPIVRSLISVPAGMSKMGMPRFLIYTILRSLISIPAGMAHMHFSKFFILTTFGSLIWNTVLVTLGAFAGASWQKTAQYFHSYSQAGKLVLCAFTLIGIFFYIKKRFQK